MYMHYNNFLSIYLNIGISRGQQNIRKNRREFGGGRDWKKGSQSNQSSKKAGQKGGPSQRKREDDRRTRKGTQHLYILFLFNPFLDLYLCDYIRLGKEHN